MTGERKGEGLLLLAAIIGGVGFLNMKSLLLEGWQPFQIIAIRFFIGTVLIGVIYPKKIKGIGKGEAKAGMLLGVLLFLLFAFLTVGLRYTSPSVNAFLTNIQAVLVPFLLWIFYKKKPPFRCVVAAFLTAFGVYLLAGGGKFSLGLGEVLSLIASLCFAIQMAVLGNLVLQYEAVALTMVEHVVVLVLAGVCSFISGESLPPVSKMAVFNFLVVGIFCTGLNFLLQSIGQKTASADKAAIIITTESVFAAILAAILFGERLSLLGYVGCGVIFFAVILAEEKNLFQRKRDSVVIAED